MSGAIKLKISQALLGGPASISGVQWRTADRSAPCCPNPKPSLSRHFPDQAPRFEQAEVAMQRRGRDPGPGNELRYGHHRMPGQNLDQQDRRPARQIGAGDQRLCMSDAYRSSFSSAERTEFCASASPARNLRSTGPPPVSAPIPAMVSGRKGSASASGSGRATAVLRLLRRHCHETDLSGL